VSQSSTGVLPFCLLGDLIRSVVKRYTILKNRYKCIYRDLQFKLIRTSLELIRQDVNTCVKFVCLRLLIWTDVPQPKPAAPGRLRAGFHLPVCLRGKRWKRCAAVERLNAPKNCKKMNQQLRLIRTRACVLTVGPIFVLEEKTESAIIHALNPS